MKAHIYHSIRTEGKQGQGRTVKSMYLRVVCRSKIDGEKDNIYTSYRFFYVIVLPV